MSTARERSDQFTGPLSGRVSPLPIALRLDMALQIGSRGTVPATKITWVTPESGSRWVRGIEIFLLPN